MSLSFHQSAFLKTTLKHQSHADFLSLSSRLLIVMTTTMRRCKSTKTLNWVVARDFFSYFSIASRLLWIAMMLTRIRFTDIAAGNKSDFIQRALHMRFLIFHSVRFFFCFLASHQDEKICVERILQSYQWWMECLTVYGAAVICAWAHELRSHKFLGENISFAMLTRWIMDENMHEQTSCA